MNFNNKYIIAIMGPSGSGKTTLGYNLSARKKIVIPHHCTTRTKRSDDKDDFYRYLQHDEYRNLFERGEFLISSGDGPIVSKEFGNFYGVLKADCLDAWKLSRSIILFVSYKDIQDLVSLQTTGLEIDIVNLAFMNIEKSVKERLTNDLTRNHTEKDIYNRIKNAIADDIKYRNLLKEYAKTIVYTDILNIEETYQKVCKDLKLKK